MSKRTGVGTESSDFQGTFAAVWRNASLYIAIELTDDQIETAHEKVAMQDRLEVYIDTGHSGQQSDLYRYTLPCWARHRAG